MKLSISKAGYNYNDTDPTHLVFSTDYNSIKTAYYSSFTVGVAAESSTDVSFSNDIYPNVGGETAPLTWVPLCIAYFTEEQPNPADNQYFIAMSNPLPYVGDRSAGNFNVQLSVTSGDVVFTIINFDASDRDCTIYFEIFYEGI